MCGRADVVRLDGCGLQVKAREETLARDEERHQQLKEESKKQVSPPPSYTAVYVHFSHAHTDMCNQLPYLK